MCSYYLADLYSYKLLNRKRCFLLHRSLKQRRSTLEIIALVHPADHYTCVISSYIILHPLTFSN